MYSFIQWLGEEVDTTVFPVKNQNSLTKEKAKNGYRDRGRLLAFFDITVDICNMFTLQDIYEWFSLTTEMMN